MSNSERDRLRVILVLVVAAFVASIAYAPHRARLSWRRSLMWSMPLFGTPRGTHRSTSGDWR